MPFVRANPEVALRLMGVLCERLRHTTEQIEDVVFLDAPSRLAKKLLQLADARQQRAVTISQRELGNMIGLSRESINKQLWPGNMTACIKVEQGTIVAARPRRAAPQAI